MEKINMGDRMKIMAVNYVDTDLLANLFKSSEKAGYPISNIQDPFRNKIWRSNGSFQITVNNNILVINDGTVKLITLTGGIYSSPSLFAIQLQTDLNASSSGFTVSYSTVTLKFTISRSSAFSLLWSDSRTTCTDTLGFNNVDDTGSMSYEGHELRVCWPAEWITFDLGIVDNPKAIFIIDSQDSDIKIQAWTQTLLQGAISNSWNTPENLAISYHHQLMGSINMAGLFEDGKRYFRLYIPDFNNPYGYIQLGKVYLGDAYEIEGSDIQREFPETYVDLSNLERAISGEIYADEKASYHIFGSIQINLCNKNDVDYIKDVWERHKTFKPFFISFDSSLKVTNNLSEWTKYVRFTASPEFTTVTCDAFNISMQVEEVL
jgi:hypothetical protein